MQTQGIVIWARSGSGSLIVWCADNGALVYVADRREAGDSHAALCVGDFVDLQVDTQGAMRVGSDLRYRATGAHWVCDELDREARPLRGPVMSPSPLLGFGPGFAAEPIEAGQPANTPARSGTGAA